jgi:hypothetical protein
MSKSGRAAYDAQQQERGADNYLAEEGERRHEIEQRITALEEANAGPFLGDVAQERLVFALADLKKAARSLTEALRENGYPKQPEPTQSEDIPF